MSVVIWTVIPNELPINSLTTTALVRSLLYLQKWNTETGVVHNLNEVISCFLQQRLDKIIQDN
jgi:hypothetical protein